MTLALAFWVVILFWVVLHGIGIYRGIITEGSGLAYIVPFLLLFLLFVLLGWAVFGAPIKG